MIRKILSPVNQAITHVQDWADEKLRHLCGHMTPEIRGGNPAYAPVLRRAIHLLYGIIHLPDRKREWRNHTDRAYQAVTATR